MLCTIHSVVSAFFCQCIIKPVVIHVQTSAHVYIISGMLYLGPGPSADSSAKKQEQTPATAADGTAYDLSDNQELPSWITERVRPCQRVIGQSAPHPIPPQQHPTPAEGPGPQPELVLYWMRTAIR